MVKCNICNNKNNKIIFVKYRYKLVKCSVCGLVYVSNPPTQKELLKLYSFNSDYHTFFLNEQSKEFKHHLNLSKQFYKLIKKYKKGKLLDIGCSAGLFLNLAKEKGWETYGVEISKDTANIAIQKYGLNVFNGDLEKANFKTKFFDVITIFDVIEHVKNPTRTMYFINRLLKDEGVLILSTPNIDGIFPVLSYKVSKLINYWPHPEPPHHLFQFSKKTIKRLLNKTGFEVLKISHKDIPFSYSFSSNWIKSFLKLVYFIIFKPVSFIGARINSGDWIFVTAKKKYNK